MKPFTERGIGEAGRRFAVVASEVKSLTTQTAKATEGIAAQIAEIQSVTGDLRSILRGSLRSHLRMKQRIAAQDVLHAEVLAAQRRASKHARRFRET